MHRTDVTNYSTQVTKKGEIYQQQEALNEDLLQYQDLKDIPIEKYNQYYPFFENLKENKEKSNSENVKICHNNIVNSDDEYFPDSDEEY